MKTPQTLPVTGQLLKERFIRACGMKQAVNWEKIVASFQQWTAAFGIEVSAIVRIEGSAQLRKTANDAYLASSAMALKAAKMQSDKLTTPGRLMESVERRILASLSPRMDRYLRSTPKGAWAEKTERLASFANMRNAVSVAAAASAVWAEKIAVAAGAARSVWDSHVVWNQGVEWDATLNAIAAIDAFEYPHQVRKFANWYPMFEAFEAGAFCFFITRRHVEVCTLPSTIRVDDHNRLHSTSGPAFVWLNDVRNYYWHGVRVEPYVVESPELITVTDIEAEPNAEVRRVKIERFGHANYLVASGAQEIHRDDYGILFRKEVPGDEPLLMVKVVNATSEPDGSFKDYFLRVPPTMLTAREAVAWTFGKSPEDYEPVKET